MKLQILAAMSAVILPRVMSIVSLLGVIALNARKLKAVTHIITHLSIFAVIAWANGLKLMGSLRCLTNDTK